MAQEKEAFNNVKVFGADKKTQFRGDQVYFLCGTQGSILPKTSSIETGLIAKMAFKMGTLKLQIDRLKHY